MTTPITSGTRVCLDSSVLIPALGERPNDTWSETCVRCLDLLLENGCSVFYSAHSLAEFLRHDVSEPPKMARLRPEPFDAKAARLMSKFNVNDLKEVRDDHGGPMNYYKYDTLIVATAMRHNAHIFVGRDGGQARLAKRAELPFMTPYQVVAALSPAQATMDFTLPVPLPLEEPDLEDALRHLGRQEQVREAGHDVIAGFRLESAS